MNLELNRAQFDLLIFSMGVASERYHGSSLEGPFNDLLLHLVVSNSATSPAPALSLASAGLPAIYVQHEPGCAASSVPSTNPGICSCHSGKPRAILWAATPDGKHPAKYEVKTLTVRKVQRKDPGGGLPAGCMLVLVDGLSSAGAKLQPVTVWDPALFAPVANKATQPWVYYITRSPDGKSTISGMDQP